jgi:hypothetical protein
VGQIEDPMPLRFLIFEQCFVGQALGASAIQQNPKSAAESRAQTERLPHKRK